MSDSYKFKHHGVDDTTNTCANPALSEVLEARFSRRGLLQGGSALGIAGVLSGSFATGRSRQRAVCQEGAAAGLQAGAVRF
ncbi:hypothetical protein ACFSQE_19440 [Vogesella fluminis]|uniref:hypothetical protein n=1 Tax=Vogesella fluminis TaxID=1069161 RepID=UPI00363CFEE8